MTFQSLALRMKEVRDLQKEYFRTRDLNVLGRLKDMERELDILVNSIITAYQGRLPQNFDDSYVDVDQFGL